MPKEKLVIPTLDFTEVSRNSKTIFTEILVENPETCAMDTWIKCGEITIQPKGTLNRADVFAKFGDNVSDFEHDSANIFRFEVIGLALSVCGVYSGITRLEGYIGRHDSFSQFSIPNQDYDPFHNSTICNGKKYCRFEKPHKIVENFSPSHNSDMYKFFIGRKIEIITGAKGAKE